MEDERLFVTHEVRRRLPVPSLWDFALGPEMRYVFPLDTPAGPMEIAPVTRPSFKGDEPTALPERYTHKMAVPGVWEVTEVGRLHRGRAFYRTSFHLDRKARVRVYFGGLSHTAWVYIDRKPIITHYNAFTAFDAVTERLEPGAHTVEVEVSNGYSPESTLHVPQDYFNYGGISRPVVFEIVPDVFIDRVEVQTVSLDKNAAQLRIAVLLKNTGEAAAHAPVTAMVREAGLAVDFGIVEVPAGSVAKAEKQITVKKPRVWSMFEGNLYTVHVRTPDDDLIERFGIRTIAVKGTDILLNGRPIRLWGFNRHEDHPEFGCALPLAVQQEDMRLLLETGANFLRTSHYPNDPRTLDLCDELGILVWEESHQRGLWIKDGEWRPDMGSMGLPCFLPQAIQCHREMIAQHYNHPCIILWAHMNECQEGDARGEEIFRTLYDELRKDGSRPVTHASCFPWNGRALKMGDVLSINAYFGWYHSSYEDWTAYVDKVLLFEEKNLGVTPRPFIVSEFGGGAIPGYYSPHLAKWSEEYQAVLLDRTLEQLIAHPRVNGMAIWQFCDVRVDDFVAMRRPRTMNNKGVVDQYRRPKLAFAAVKKHYTRLKEEYLRNR